MRLDLKFKKKVYSIAGMRTEGDDSITSPWQSYTMEERDQIKAAAREKIHGTFAGITY